MRPPTPSVRSVPSPTAGSPASRRATRRAARVPPEGSRHRVVAVEQARPVDEVLVLRERHVGVLRGRVGRIEGDDRAEVAALARAKCTPQRLAGALGSGLALGLDAGVGRVFTSASMVDRRALTSARRSGLIGRVARVLRRSSSGAPSTSRRRCGWPPAASTPQSSWTSGAAAGPVSMQTRSPGPTLVE